MKQGHSSVYLSHQVMSDFDDDDPSEDYDDPSESEFSPSDSDDSRVKKKSKKPVKKVTFN